MKATATRPSSRRRRRVGVLAALIVAIGLVAWWRWSVSGRWRGLSADRVPLLRPTALTILPGVHLLGGLDPSAAYAIETARGLVLVDSGLRGDAGRIGEQLAELGLASRPVRTVLLTHSHGDHSGGAQALRERFGAIVYAGKGDAPVLRAGGPREAFFSTFSMPRDTPHPTTV